MARGRKRFKRPYKTSVPEDFFQPKLPKIRDDGKRQDGHDHLKRLRQAADALPLDHPKRTVFESLHQKLLQMMTHS